MRPRILGIDIGGANLKAADTLGRAMLTPFPLWKQPERLVHELRKLFREYADVDRLAITMTGELCDCFQSKREGVHHILTAVEQAADTRDIRIWQNTGRFVDLAAAFASSLQIASANWLALATFAGRWARAGTALMIDVGSTTTDIVPLVDGRPAPGGRTDPERLRCRELVYTGVRRTPACALLGSDGAAEFFATMEDVYVFLGDLPEDETNRDTADRQPMTRLAAERRLARMLCADLETSTADARRSLARVCADRQAQALAEATRSVIGRLLCAPTSIILAGSGEFLATKVITGLSERHPCRVHWLSRELGPDVSTCACAYAVAVLAAEEEDALR